MSGKVWRGSAPSNIALIKYMGKTDSSLNQASNPSLSLTLEHLRTHVELELIEGETPRWEPLAGFTELKLSVRGQERFLNHLKMLARRFDLPAGFIVRSANDFPSDCGLASSASSFAALTRVAASALSELSGRPAPSVETQAEWSRQGSGSSCRSFFSPWCVWDGSRIEAFECAYPTLLHQAVIVDATQKEVSSSDAHQRIATSLLNLHRGERARARMTALTDALKAGDWGLAYQITWAEFRDMHALFETAMPPFSYLSSDSLGVLERLRAHWEKVGDGPLVTMDAGANVHLLYRLDQRDMMASLGKELGTRFSVVANV